MFLLLVVLLQVQILQIQIEKIPMKSCANCSSPISGRSIKVDTDCMYHVDCFVCAICKKSLLQLPWCNFEGKPYCRSDYQSLFAPKCGKMWKYSY